MGRQEVVVTDSPELDFDGYWRRLQQIGLNAYEARSYVVLLGHQRFKALELAARAHVPRQKIYEVLDSLAAKGFAQVVQEKTKVFSAVEPALAVPGFVARQQQKLQSELQKQSLLAGALTDDLKSIYSQGRGGRGTLDFLRIVSDPAQSGAQYRAMLAAACVEYLEFSRPPYAVDPLDEALVKNACRRGVACRLLVDTTAMDNEQLARVHDYVQCGVAVRQAESLPMKLALFDGRQGLIALLDPVITKPAWTSVVFEHEGMGEAMRGLFEQRWALGTPIRPR